MMTARTLIAFALLCCGAQAGAASRVAGGLEEQVDALTRDGYEHPAEALAALTQLQREHATAPDARRTLLQAMGSIEARAGAAARAAVYAEQLQALAGDDASGRT